MKKIFFILTTLFSISVFAQTMSLKEIEKQEEELTMQVLVELKTNGVSDREIDKMLAIKDKQKSKEAILRKASPELKRKIQDLAEEKAKWLSK